MTKQLKATFIYLGLALVGLASLWFYYHYQSQAFPEHTVNFALDRTGAEEKAQSFLKELGYSVDSYRHTTYFSSSYGNVGFLERTLGQEKTSQLAAEKIDLWRFTSRFFKENQQEELSVDFHPDGRLVRFDHTIPDDQAGASLSQEAARELAQQAGKQYFHVDLTGFDWRLRSSESVKQLNRTDHTFEWTTSYTDKEADDYEISITIAGDKVQTLYQSYLTPESWQRQHANELTQGLSAQLVAEALTLLLFGTALSSAFIQALR